MSATRVANSWWVHLVNSFEISRSKVPLFTFSIKLFKVYAIKNREILTCHEITIGKIDNDEGDDEDEYDPQEIWSAVQEVSVEYRFFIGKVFSPWMKSSFLFQGDASCDRESDDTWNRAKWYCSNRYYESARDVPSMEQEVGRGLQRALLLRQQAQQDPRANSVKDEEQAKLFEEFLWIAVWCVSFISVACYAILFL